ncbi:MAG: HAMP domain-containing sensor histidine kinase, partial [Cyanobacteria bacterium J06649_5]
RPQSLPYPQCRAQLQLLTQQLSDCAAALYIVDMAETEGDRDSANYIPVVSYPESVDSWVVNFARATNWAGTQPAMSPLALPGTAEGAASAAGDSATAELETGRSETLHSETLHSHHDHDDPAGPSTQAVAEEAPFGWPEILHPEQQLVVPLMYTDVVVGLLISVRGDRAWETDERSHIEAVAQSLAAGCVLERRTQWLQSQLARKQGLQSRQSEIFHNLLHQFRNPLTAVSTFGQLLVKRIEPEDPNAPVVTGIVRESKRLRELVTHFDEAVAIGDADLATDTSADTSTLPLLPAAPERLAPNPTRPTLNDGHTPPMRTLTGLDSSEHRPGTGNDYSAAGVGLGHALTLAAQYLPDIVNPVLAVSHIVATEKKVALNWQITTDTPAVWGEEEALTEVVSNLVDNAVKYSPPGAQVWVQTGVSQVGEDSHDHYQGIVIGDTGPGIPKQDLARLFERNYRGVQAHGTIPGTGLGLAIAQSLIQAMGGSIEVITPAVGTPWLPPVNPARDISVGPGTVFIVWLLEVQR